MRDNRYDVDKQSRQLGQAQIAMTDQVAKSTEAWMKAAARAGNEATGLVGRRMRAYTEIPSRLGHCKGPSDLQAEQVRFWQTCAQDYAQATRSIVEAWSAVMPMAAFNPASFGLSADATPSLWTWGMVGEKPTSERERDTLKMPEQAPRQPAPQPGNSTYDLPRQSARRPAA